MIISSDDMLEIEGSNAYNDGVEFEQSPYALGTMERCCWSVGWLKAQRWTEDMEDAR